MILDNKANRHFLGTLYFDRALAIIARGYYHAGKNEKALATATRATERSGADAPDAYWWGGLAAWRLDRHDVAAAHFSAMARAPGLRDWPRAAAAFWAARAALVGREPAKVTPMLRLGARYPYTFYGMLAMQALDEPSPFDWALPRLGAVETELLQHIPAAKRALALIEAGQSVRAESELKRLTGAPSPELSRVLLALIGKASLPDVSIRLGLRLARAGGARHDAALFPAPDWTPRGGYTLDKALIFAFIRQESRFTTQAKSRPRPAGLIPLSGVSLLERPEDIGPGYDAVWIAGFTDAHWPRPAQPNPLLPLRLQRVENRVPVGNQAPGWRLRLWPTRKCCQYCRHRPLSLPSVAQGREDVPRRRLFPEPRSRSV